MSEKHEPVSNNQEEQRQQAIVDLITRTAPFLDYIACKNMWLSNNHTDELLEKGHCILIIRRKDGPDFNIIGIYVEASNVSDPSTINKIGYKFFVKTQADDTGLIETDLVINVDEQGHPIVDPNSEDQFYNYVDMIRIFLDKDIYDIEIVEEKLELVASYDTKDSVSDKIGKERSGVFKGLFRILNKKKLEIESMNNEEIKNKLNSLKSEYLECNKEYIDLCAQSIKEHDDIWKLHDLQDSIQDIRKVAKKLVRELKERKVEHDNWWNEILGIK